MKNNLMNRLAMLFRNALIGMAAPLWAIEIPDDSDFPTRTIEVEEFSFDHATGTIHWSQSGNKETYSLEMDGMIDNPVKLTYAELRSLPSFTQVNDFHCVEGWTVPQVKWSGLRFQDLLALAKPLKGADFAVFHSLGKTYSAPSGQQNYIECLSVADLLDPEQEMLLALDVDGSPLSYERGAPMRIVTPYRQAYKAAKFIHRIELTDKPKSGWWTLANPIYDSDALVPSRRLKQE